MPLKVISNNGNSLNYSDDEGKKSGKVNFQTDTKIHPVNKKIRVILIKTVFKKIDHEIVFVSLSLSPLIFVLF